MVYLSERRRPTSDRGAYLPRADRERWRVGMLVGLGLTSLFTDISSELVTSVLPAFLVVQLGYSALALGALDASQQVVHAVVRPLGALVADRWQRHRPVAAFGYGLGLAGKVVLAAIGTSVLPIAAAIGLDRIGKGLRTGPRDALVASCAPPERLATAFGVHRAFDTAGALAGPLLGVALLAASPDRFRPVFVVAAVAAVVGLALLFLLVPGDRAQPAIRADRTIPADQTIPVDLTIPADPGGQVIAAVEVPTRIGLRRVLGDPAVRRLVVAAGVLGPFVVGDVFLHLAVQQQAGLPIAAIPALFAATAATFLVLAIPAGALADRIGARPVLLAGHLALLPGYALLAVDGPAAITVAAVVVGVGAHAAGADGVLAAQAATVAPPAWRATTIALVTTTGVLSRALSSLVAGTLWASGGVGGPFVVALVGLPIAVAVAAVALAGVDRPVPMSPGRVS